jgi:hypothetical protein
MFWMPDQVRHDDLGTFYELIFLSKENPLIIDSRWLVLLGSLIFPLGKQMSLGSQLD